MIDVEIPREFGPEVEYAVGVMLGDFLGICDVKVIRTAGEGIALRGRGKSLFTNGEFFRRSGQAWLQEGSLPSIPAEGWSVTEDLPEVNVAEPCLPVLYGKPLSSNRFLSESPHEIRLGLDVFGSAFFMLSRYEEAVTRAMDVHDRFPLEASIGAAFVSRPIVNEYAEVLWACIQRLWPELERKRRSFKMIVSHDVDALTDKTLYGVSGLARRIGGDVLRRRSVFRAANTMKTAIQVRMKGVEADPCFTFEYIMDLSERNNLASAFYFITDRPAGRIDGSYSIRDQNTRKLLRQIHSRGHELGLHASYNTVRDSAQTLKEFNILRDICAEEGVQREKWGGRQHYLRWRTPETFRNWDLAGLDYDSTLTYPERPGFRCGACYEYPAYDVQERKPLRLRERPLIAMERSVLSRKYMYLGGEAAFRVFEDVKNTCRRFSGDFTLLWHNTSLVEPEDRELYEAVLST